MSERVKWLAVFLGVTVLAVAMELWASFDGDPGTDPWTDLIVAHVPMEVTFVVIGGLILWLPIHFGVRYWRRRQHRDRSA